MTRAELDLGLRLILTRITGEDSWGKRVKAHSGAVAEWISNAEPGRAHRVGGGIRDVPRRQRRSARYGIAQHDAIGRCEAAACRRRDMEMHARTTHRPILGVRDEDGWRTRYVGVRVNELIESR